jgi:hypothetical protein
MHPFLPMNIAMNSGDHVKLKAVFSNLEIALWRLRMLKK